MRGILERSTGKGRVMSRLMIGRRRVEEMGKWGDKRKMKMRMCRRRD